MKLMLIASALALPAAAQEPPSPAPPPAPVEGPQLPGAGGEEDEMLKLFGQVERRLREIDRLLYDASAGRAPGKLEESGIDKLLKRGRESSKQVLEDIDRILELAMQRAQQQQQQQSSGSGGDPQDQPQGGSPLDERRGSSPGEREQTPEGQAPEPGKGNDGQQPSKEGEVPEGNQESPGQSDNREGGAPPELETERTAAGGDNDSWGDLPVRVRELFRAQGGGDLPPRYRDWIDSYYRRLNKRP